MSQLGVPHSIAPVWVGFECGDAVPFYPPVPQPGDELTCGVCGEPTEVPRDLEREASRVHSLLTRVGRSA